MRASPRIRSARGAERYLAECFDSSSVPDRSIPADSLDAMDIPPHMNSSVHKAGTQTAEESSAWHTFPAFLPSCRFFFDKYKEVFLMFENRPFFQTRPKGQLHSAQSLFTGQSPILPGRLGILFDKAPAIQPDLSSTYLCRRYRPEPESGHGPAAHIPLPA